MKNYSHLLDARGDLVFLGLLVLLEGLAVGVVGVICHQFQPPTLSGRGRFIACQNLEGFLVQGLGREKTEVLEEEEGRIDHGKQTHHH